MESFFSAQLLDWNDRFNHRSLPWKGEKDPYKIWLSEIILQQTRVQQGKGYYERFLAAFPQIIDLAAADDRVVFKLWEGLGYYSRCKNLLKTARLLVKDFGGLFPPSHEALLALPGVGPYTAAALGSFAFDLPHAVVDGNVERVLARYFAMAGGTQAGRAKKLYRVLADDLLGQTRSSTFNQAIMDLGAVICTPTRPGCQICPLQSDCESFRKGWVNLLPQKMPPSPRRMRYFHYFLIDAGEGRIWMRKRTGRDIWQDLYEFVLWEDQQMLPHQATQGLAELAGQGGGQDLSIARVSEVFRQTLTHQIVHACFVWVRGKMARLDGYEAVGLDDVGSYPFPRMIASRLDSLLKSDVNQVFDRSCQKHPMGGSKVVF